MESQQIANKADQFMVTAYSKNWESGHQQVRLKQPSANNQEKCFLLEVVNMEKETHFSKFIL